MRIVEFIQKNVRGDLLDKVMVVTTKLGDKGAAWVLTALLLIATKKHRPIGVAMLVALIFGVLISEVLMKPLVGRARPCAENPDVALLIKRPRGYSFPSSHALVSFAAAAVVYCADKRWGLAAFVLAATIAFSRVYLYVHYLSDIIAGAFLGAAIGAYARYDVRLALRKWA
ncbi:MAG: phosphatase PAP2 family protein [Oscillospiraceae bacterium]|nr:phosphatase PAP2 family protein [Oscillospiraceae bacterium]